MARPTQRTLTRSPSYAPAVRQGPALGVFAPLNVSVPSGGGAQLAEALGMLNTVAQPILADRAQRKGAEASAQGMADAQLNKVDAKRQKEDALYDRGTRRVMVEKAAQDAFAEWSAEYDQTDLKNSGEDDVRASYDQFMQQRLGGLVNDPEAAGWLAERLGPLEAKVMGAHRAKLAADFRDTTVATAGDALRADILTGTAPNVEGVMSMLRPVLGNSEATKQYVDMVGALAAERGEPSLLDRLIPEKWQDGTPGARSIPALAEAINKARYLAESAAEAGEREAKKAADAQIETSTIAALQQAAGGDIAGAIKSLDALAATGTMTAAEYSARRSYIEGRQDYINEQRYNPTALAEFRLKLASDPLSITQGQILSQVRTLFPNDRAGTSMAAQLLDDVVQTQKAARAQEANPTAKAYRSAIVAKYKPDSSLSTQAQKDRYAAITLAFDLSFAQTDDPKKALAAADEVINGTAPEAGKATGALDSDLKALAAGSLSGPAFTQRYGERSLDAINDAVRKGQLSPTEGSAAIDALNQ